MPDSPWFSLQSTGGRPTLHLSGAWRLADLAQIEAALAATQFPAAVAVDAGKLSQIDSAAALVLLRHLQAGENGKSGASGANQKDWSGLSETHARILARVREQMGEVGGLQANPGDDLLAHIGRHTVELGALLQGHLNFFGTTLVALGSLVLRPARLRRRELTVQLEHTGLDAIPVIALVTLLIGVVVAYLLGLQAEKYGANIFVVDGVGIGATREFAPIIVAVVVAGRSGASFTAQLGSMRLTEEIDAIRTLGLDVWQVLVVPRVLALMIALPLLVFVGDIMSLLGAMTIGSAMLDITPAGFLARLHESLDLRHVVIGLVKAPVFALVIAVIGTRMGMTVGRDTRAVGAATTSTVVQSIVAVILLDAGFAMLFQALDW